MKISLILGALLMSLQIAAAKIEVDVEGMTCGMCVSAIKKELEATERVQNISVNLEAKTARFEEMKDKRIPDSEIRSAIKKAGYTVVKITRKNQPK